VGGLVARPCQNSPTQTGGDGFNSHRVHNFCHKQINQWRGATWQPMTGPHGIILLAYIKDTCQPPIRPHLHLPRQSVATWLYRPCHVSPCHVSPLQWCHVLQSNSSTCLPACLPCQHATHCHITCMVIWTVQSSTTSALYRLYSQQNFACLAKQIDRNIFRIQCSFEPVQVALGL
jgi:hypothetical protein